MTLLSVSVSPPLEKPLLKIDIQLKMTTEAHPVSPIKNIVSST